MQEIILWGGKWNPIFRFDNFIHDTLDDKGTKPVRVLTQDTEGSGDCASLTDQEAAVSSFRINESAVHFFLHILYSLYKRLIKALQ